MGLPNRRLKKHICGIGNYHVSYRITNAKTQAALKKQKILCSFISKKIALMEKTNAFEESTTYAAKMKIDSRID